MKISELVHRSKEDLEKLQQDLREELRKLRFDTVLSSLGNPARIRLARRDIARVQTLLREYQLGIRNYEKTEAVPATKKKELSKKEIGKKETRQKETKKKETFFKKSLEKVGKKVSRKKEKT